MRNHFHLAPKAFGAGARERIFAQELKRHKWRAGELRERLKSDPAKLQVAMRLRRETTQTIRQIAQCLHMGTWKTLNNKLYLAAKASTTRETARK
jgi:hypothetical protein